MPDPVYLSTLQPDFEGIRSQLQSRLSTKDAWKGLLPTQTGQALLDFIATVGSSAQMKGLRFSQDAFSETAIAARAQYAIADTQGLRLTRKTPASLTVNISYVDPTRVGAAGSGANPSATIVAFTQFQGAGTYWFSTESVVVADGDTEAVTFYQGYVIDQTIQGPGYDYVTFVSPEKNFTVSDMDGHVVVYANGDRQDVVRDGLWMHRNDGGSAQKVLDRTTPDGRLKLSFGNDNFGYKPANTDVVRIIYAVTSGSDGNNISVTDAKINPVTTLASGLTYAFVSTPTGGGDQPSPLTYKSLSASNFGNFDSAVTRDQYKNTALSYPGVVDAKTFAQRELDPTDVRKMNVIQLTLLTTSGWDALAKAAFLAYMQKSCMYAPIMYLNDPVAVPRTLRVLLRCFNWADATQCAADADDAIRALFALRSNYLSWDIAVSDITVAAINSNSGIEYLDILEPTQDMIVSARPMQQPVLTTSDSYGTLPPALYSYAVYAEDANGKTRPANFSSINVTDSGSHVTLTWDPYPGAIKYWIVGRYGAQGNIGSTTDLTFVDDGSADPLVVDPINNPTLPTLADYPILYNTLASLTIDVRYSERSL
jgi:hypothetical protein